MLDQRFIGMEQMTVDEKFRVGIPSKFMPMLRKIDPSEDLQVGLVLTPDRSIKIMPMPAFNRMLERWENYNESFEEERLLLNLEPATAEVAGLDKQNRIKLNPWMLRKCGISRDVVVIGSRDCLQIFSDQVYDEYYDVSRKDWSKAGSAAANRQAGQQLKRND